jgi:hypothetical protein
MMRNLPFAVGPEVRALFISKRAPLCSEARSRGIRDSQVFQAQGKSKAMPHGRELAEGTIVSIGY